MDSYIYYDKQGNAVGVGEEAQFHASGPKRGSVVTQDIHLTNGTFTSRKEKIDKATAKDIHDESKKLSLKDFKINSI